MIRGNAEYIVTGDADPKDSDAKVYQVRQVRLLILKHGLEEVS